MHHKLIRPIVPIEQQLNNNLFKFQMAKTFPGPAGYADATASSSEIKCFYFLGKVGTCS